MARHRRGALPHALVALPVALPVALALLLVHVAVSAESPTASGPLAFGVRALDIRVGCTTPLAATHAARAGANWRRNASFAVERPPAAHFLVLRFARLRLPPRATLVVRDATPRGATLLHFQGNDETDWHAPDLAFYSRPLAVERVVIEYTVPHEIDRVGGGCYGVHIDELRFAARSASRVTPALQRRRMYRKKAPVPSLVGDHKEASVDALSNTEHDDAPECVDDGRRDGDDDSTSARVACVRFDTAVFSASRAVARLLVHKDGGSVFCTGWLLGCEGHVLTNHHCVATQREADATSIEFLAQGRECNQSCETPMGCPGVVEVTSSDLVAFSPLEALDFSLLLPRLPRERRRNLTTTYGHLALRARAAAADERIFIPQHPAGFGKRVALKAGAAYGRVESLKDAGCNERKENLGYKLDTQGGSSGAPVIAYSDKTVVGLHYCGGCLNSAIPAHRIVDTLVDVGRLPQCAQADDDKQVDR